MAWQSLRTNDYIDGILEKYSQMVYQIAFTRVKNKADAEDIMQDVFVRFIRCKTQFNDETHIRSWLIRASVNCSKSMLSSFWRKQTAELDEEMLVHIDPDDSVYLCVLELPKKYRTVIILHYYEDIPTAELAKILKIKESTVRSHLFRARKLLKEKLKGDYLDDME